MRQEVINLTYHFLSKWLKAVLNYSRRVNLKQIKKKPRQQYANYWKSKHGQFPRRSQANDGRRNLKNIITLEKIH